MAEIINEEIILTQEGYDKIVAEHEELVAVKRAEVAERIKEAISYGDISENAEYDAAKDEQAELEERIQKLETMMRNARIINEAEISEDQVNVGVTVTVRDEDLGEEISFMIVGSTEADPFAEPAKITNDSKVGHELIGKHIDDMVEISVPDGILHYTIIGISK